jgi:hypothetical protein
LVNDADGGYDSRPRERIILSDLGIELMKFIKNIGGLNPE